MSLKRYKIKYSLSFLIVFFFIVCIVFFSKISESSKQEAKPDTNPEMTQTTITKNAVQAKICEKYTPSTLTKITDPRFSEISGLASLNDTIWANNDSRSEIGLLQFKPDTLETKFTRLNIPKKQYVDPEDLAQNNGKLFLADIGDNFRDEIRTQIYIHEIDPESTKILKTTTLNYPDEPKDAEAFFIDPISQEAYIIEKSVSLGTAILGADTARIYKTRLGSNPLLIKTNTEINLIDLKNKAKSSMPEDENIKRFPQVITGADINKSGNLIAIRTYQSIWLYARNQNQSVEESLASEPCELKTILEPQGESITFYGNDLISISEGTNPQVNLYKFTQNQN